MADARATVREAHFLSSGQELVNAAACGKTDSGSPPTSGCAVIHSLSAFRSVKLLASSLTCPSLPELALVRMKSSRPSARAAWAKCTAPTLPGWGATWERKSGGWGKRVGLGGGGVHIEL